MTTISEVQDTWSKVRKAKHAQVVEKRDQLGWREARRSTPSKRVQIVRSRFATAKTTPHSEGVQPSRSLFSTAAHFAFRTLDHGLEVNGLVSCTSLIVVIAPSRHSLAAL